MNDLDYIDYFHASIREHIRDNFRQRQENVSLEYAHEYLWHMACGLIVEVGGFKTLQVTAPHILVTASIIMELALDHNSEVD